MAIMIAVRTVSGYRSARVEYGASDLYETLRYNWGRQMAMHSLVAAGDMMSLGKNTAIRSVNHDQARNTDDFISLIKNSANEGIHKTIIYDESNQTLDSYAEWNMDCSEGEDLFLENISEAGPWYVICDKYMIQEIFNRKAA